MFFRDGPMGFPSPVNLSVSLLVVMSSTAFASPFVGSPREYALGIGALGTAALLEQWPPNRSHPLIGGEQKPYIERERVPDWALAGAHLVTIAAIRFSDSPDRVRYAHGYGMAVALTQATTSFTKGIVGRKRPNEDAAVALGKSSKSRSFFSGHASTGFCLATYSSAYAWRASPKLEVRAGVPLATYGAATYAAWSRVAEHRHYPADVIAGAAAGTAIGALVFRWYDGMEAGGRAGASASVFPLPRGAAVSVAF